MNGIGRPVPIVIVDDDTHTFRLDEEALAGVLSNEEVRDKPVCVISVAGSSRHGKSFLLNFLLRFLEHEGSNDWLGSEDDPLKGFHWRGGCDRDTTGILIWSKVFVVKVSDSKEVAVILMDTQGAFDGKSIIRNSAAILALSTLLSSTLMYNLTSDIKEDSLQWLDLCASYGLLVLNDVGEKPFQRLQFLVRDWSCPYAFPYGEEGGNGLVEKRLQVTGTQHEELRGLRNNIHACFSSIGGFLMPHPGKAVSTSHTFDGRLRDIDEEFTDHLRAFVPLLLAPRNLEVKRIGGDEVRCKDIEYFFKSFVELFQSDEMPEPVTIFRATSEANNRVAISEARDEYVELMEGLCGKGKPGIDKSKLEADHKIFRERVLKMFSRKKKIGGDDGRYRKVLEREVDRLYDVYKQRNDAKNAKRKAIHSAVGVGVAATVAVATTVGVAVAWPAIAVTGAAMAFKAGT